MSFIKKITSVLASAVMLGSSVGFAAAATYPAPFISGGAANVAVVVTSGSHVGSSSDILAAVDLGQNLQVELAKQTATTTSTGASATGGDSVNLGTSTRKLYYADSINAARSSLSVTELGDVLADGTFVDLTGTEYDYTQSIVSGDTVSVFGTSGGDIDDPVLYLEVGTTATDPLYNYTLTFNKNLNISDGTNVQGEKISVLGIEYVIGASSTNTTLYLYGSGETVTVAGGESATVTIGDTEHTIELITTSSSTQAKISVDGTSKTVTKSSKYQFPGDVVVYVKDIVHPAYAGDLRNAELILGAKALKLQNGQTVKEGADETSIKGTNVAISAADVGKISGFTVQVAMEKSKADHIGIGDKFLDPVFGGLEIQFAGAVPALDSDARGNLVVDTDNNQYAYVTFISARAGSAGEQRITYTYDNNTASTAVQPLLAHQTITAANKGHIHVAEGANAKESDWIVVNQGDAGTILEVTDISIDTATSGTVTFEDAITGDSQKITLTNSSGTYEKTGVNFYGGNGYTVRANSAGTTVNITWTSGTAVFPRIKLKDGGWIALLTDTVVANGTSVIFPDGKTTITTSGTTVANYTTNYKPNGINWTAKNNGGNVEIYGIDPDDDATVECNFNTTIGPAVLFLEPKKWDDSDYGDFICVPLTTTGTTEIAIANPEMEGTNSGFVTLTSDTYKKQAVDKYGALITKEDRTNENGVATIAYPKSQMYLDVLFTAEDVSVTAGTSGTGTVTELGSVTVKDSEASSVESKNLIVIGGSCINSVAAEIIGSSACGADFTAATGVGADQFLIKVVDSPYTTGKVAMLVAGYEAADTTKAVKYVTAESPTTDVGTELKKVTATYADVETTTG